MHDRPMCLDERWKVDPKCAYNGYDRCYIRQFDESKFLVYTYHRNKEGSWWVDLGICGENGYDCVTLSPCFETLEAAVKAVNLICTGFEAGYALGRVLWGGNNDAK